MKGLICFFMASMLILSNALLGQGWSLVDVKEIPKLGVIDIVPQKFLLYQIDDTEMKNILWSAPKEETINVNQSNTLINVGMPDGSLQQFRVVEYSMMEPELALAYPNIKTFYGVSTSQDVTSIRIDYTDQGFRSVINSPDGKIFIDHYQRNDKNTRIVYFKNDYASKNDWSCDFMNEEIDRHQENNAGNRYGDCMFRSYRLALATTLEYSTFHGASSSAQSSLVLSAVTTVVNRVNEVYEADLAVRLVLIANTTSIFYYSSTGDSYSNNNGSSMLNQNQTVCTNVIGSANYDIGHVFSTGGGGVAFLGCVCTSSNKAKGVTGSSNPVGDPFSIDYVAHEMGHQFGGNHSFAGNTGSCSGNRNNGTAMEPGSGSSIMAYAGICTGQDVQSNSDATFHATNIQEIKTFINTGSGTCFTQIPFTNTPPTITAQPNYTIPKSTAFALTLTATDAESNPILYAWDQMNGVTGNVTTPPASTNTTGPVFRNILPTVSPTRYFPNLATILTGSTSNTWEVVPSISRTLNFRGVARDFTGLAGCNSEIDITVSTVSAAGPFIISNINSATTWNANSTQTITWNVAGTTANGINCANVQILLSTDGGLTYSTTLLASTPNNGTANITVPDVATTTGRVMVKAIGNVFLDINNANITIISNPSTYNLTANPTSISVCPAQNASTVINITQTGGYNQPITLSVAGLPSGANATFTTNPVLPDNNSTMNLTGLNTSGTYNLTINGVSGTNNKSTNVTLNILNAAGIPSLISPANMATNVSMKPTLTWAAIVGSTSYDFQMGYDNQLNDILVSNNSVSTSYVVTTNLFGGTTYYWRVRSTNGCNTGDWSPVNSFTVENCWFYNPSDLPISLSNSTAPLLSHINIADKGSVTDVNILDLSGTIPIILLSTYSLKSPSNNTSVFWNQPCGKVPDFDISFDDSAANSNWPCPPTDGLTYIPTNPLSSLNGSQLKGDWELNWQRTDAAPVTLNSWGLKVCANNFCRLMVDHTRVEGPGSLLAALACAADGDTIRFDPTIINDTINIGSQQLIINKNLVIESNISKNIHIMSSNSGPTIVNNAPTGTQELKILGLHIHSSNANIGAVQNFGKLTLENVVLHKWPGSSTSTITNQSGANTIINGDCKIVTD